MVKIVIAGAGRAGLKAALALEKRLGKNPNVSITLIDRHDYTLNKEELAWAATTDEDLVPISEIEEKISSKLRVVLEGKKINYIQGEVVKIEPQEKRIFLQGRHLFYDYLVLAMGSEPNFSNFLGFDQHSLALNNLADALRIRNALGFIVQSHRLDTVKKKIKICILGGGAFGVRLAGNFMQVLDFLSWKNQYPKENLELIIYEKNHRVLPKESYDKAREVFWRLRELGVSMEFEKEATEADSHYIKFLNGEKIEYDVLIWAGGNTEAKILIESQKPIYAKTGNLFIDDHLVAANLENVFVIGSQKGAGRNYNPNKQSEYLVYAISKLMKNKKPSVYREKIKPKKLFMPIGPKWAIYSTKRGFYKGYLGYILGKWMGKV